MPEATPLNVRPSTVYISQAYDPNYSQSPSNYTSSPTSYIRSTPTHEISKPALSSASRHQSSASTRPNTIYTSANIDQSFKVVRRQRTKKPSSNIPRRGSRNVLNQTLDNFYNTLRSTKTDQTVKSAKTWVNEYENYRKSVIYEEKEYEKYRSSLMMIDDDDSIYGNRRNECERCGNRVYDRNSTYDNSYSYRNSVYDRSPSYKNSTHEHYSSSGVAERRTHGISANNGRRQLSKNSVGVEELKVVEPLYSNYF